MEALSWDSVSKSCESGGQYGEYRMLRDETV
jgi:hypothetical protein